MLRSLFNTLMTPFVGSNNGNEFPLTPGTIKDDICPYSPADTPPGWRDPEDDTDEDVAEATTSPLAARNIRFKAETGMKAALKRIQDAKTTDYTAMDLNHDGRTTRAEV